MITAGQLGINASGSVNMVGPNAVTTLAAAVTGAGNSFAFRDNSTPLTIGEVSLAEDRAAFITGVTTQDGRIALSTTTSGGITVNQPIGSTGGEIDIAVAPGSGFTNNTDSTATLPTAITSGNGNIVVLADAMTLAANSTINAGSGTIVLGPATTGDTIVLGAASSAGTLGLQTTDLATMTAGMIQVGYRTEAATASFTGSIAIDGAGISLNPADVPALLLVTGGAGGTVTQTAPVTFSAAGGSSGHHCRRQREAERRQRGQHAGRLHRQRQQPRVHQRRETDGGGVAGAAAWHRGRWKRVCQLRADGQRRQPAEQSPGRRNRDRRRRYRDHDECGRPDAR